MTVPLSTAEQVVTAASQLGGLAVLAGTLAGVVALTYRWLTRERVPLELALLAGLAGVAVYLNTTTVLGRVIEGETDTVEAALFNAGAFLLGGVGAFAGHRLGDTFGHDVLNDGGHEGVDEDVSRLVRTVGRVTVVDLPNDVQDVVGYDSVAEGTREAIAGSQFVFPRNLTVDELDSRIRSRLKTDFGVGTVDLELADDGTVEHLAVGSHAAGIGPTLPPATNAVALRADPAFAASTGDVVQVWETDPMRRVFTGELRGVAGDVVTVAINSADTPKVDPTRTYRLVTLPVDDRPAREFASLLRAADESYTSVTVEAGSPLHGMPVGALDLAIVGIEPEDGEPVALPSREYVLSPGETVLVIGVPAALRKLERAAKPLDPSVVPETGTTPGDRTVGTGDQSPTDTDDERREDGPATPPSADPQPEMAESDSDQMATTESPETTEMTANGLDESVSRAPEPEQEDAPVAAQADSSSFDQLKAEYDEGEDWDDGEDEPGEEPIEQITDSTGGIDVGETDDEEADDGGDTSFDDLKAEFESGEADWDETDDSDGTGDSSEKADPASGGGDDLVGLDEADISFEDDTTDEEAEFGASGDDSEDDFDDLEGGFESLDDGVDDGLTLDEGGSGDGEGAEDDIASLTLEEDDGEGLFEEDSFEDDELFADETLDEDDDATDEDDATGEDGSEDDSDDDDSDDESSDDSGGSTFAQLKEEFESGEADWEDDISDSPGGDMRLDE